MCITAKIEDIFAEIINQVDIDAECILMRINQNGCPNHSIIEEEINQSRRLLIDQIDEIKRTNSDNLKKTTCPLERPFEDLLVKYCVYLESDTVRSFTFNKNRLGILLVTDFFISKSQAELLKY